MLFFVTMNKLSNALDMDVAKKAVYDKSVENVNYIDAVDTSELDKKLTTTQKLKKLMTD